MLPRSSAIPVRSQDGAWVLSLPGELGAEIEEGLIPAVERVLAGPANLLVLDFSGVTLANSAGIGVLVDLLRRARAVSVPVVVAAVGGQPRLVLGRVGFLAAVPEFASIADALRGPPAP